jgi:hypothetical protein
MTISTKKLESALVLVAGFFDEPVTNQDGKIVNKLSYVQSRILNSICYGACQSLERTKGSTHPKAKDEVRQAMKAHRGDELSEVTLNKKLDWLDRVNDQIAHLEAFAEVALKVYENATGEKFIYGSRPAATAGVRNTDAMARANAVLDDNVAPATDYQSPDASSEGRDAA